MSKNILAALAALVIVATGHNACAEGTCSVVTKWDMVSSAGYSNGTNDLSAAHGWTCPKSGIAVTNGCICIAEDSTNVITYAALSKPSSTNSYQAVTMHFNSVSIGGELDTGATFSTPVLMASETNWYGNVGGTMTRLDGAYLSDTDAEYDIRVEFSNDVHKVRYAVKKAGASEFTVLYTNNSAYTWFDTGDTDSTTNLTSLVDIGGAASFDAIAFTQGCGTISTSDVFVTRQTTQGIKDDQLNDIAKNGNPNWENLVLNLDGTNVASCPVVTPVQSTATDTVSLKLGGVDVDAASATVKYAVYSSTMLGGTETTEATDVAYNDTASVGLPSSGVKYYRMKVITTPKKSN